MQKLKDKFCQKNLEFNKIIFADKKISCRFVKVKLVE